MAFKKQPSCLMAVPEGEDFASAREAIAHTLLDRGVDLIAHVPTSNARSGASTSIAVVKRADMLIADVTDKNSSILYELGLADALGKPVLILARKSDDVPADFAGHQVLVYEPGDTEKLARYLDYWIREQPLSQYES